MRDTIGPIDPPLVGRAAEMRILGAGMDAARRGCGGLFFVAGPPGIGKTRLLAEVGQRSAEAGLRVLRGRATDAAIAYRPLSEVLFSALRRGWTPTDPEFAPYRAALSRLVPEWRPSRPPPTDDSPVILAEALLRLLSRLGA